MQPCIGAWVRPCGFCSVGRRQQSTGALPIGRHLRWATKGNEGLWLRSAIASLSFEPGVYNPAGSACVQDVRHVVDEQVECEPIHIDWR
jgi:hypothetical protein